MPTRVAYDEKCDFCILAKNAVEKYDIMENFDFVPLNLHENSEEKVRRNSGNDRISIIDNSGNVLSTGMDALIFISRGISLMFPLLPFLIFLKKVGLGQIAYDFVARRRMLISALIRRR